VNPRTQILTPKKGHFNVVCIAFVTVLNVVKFYPFLGYFFYISNINTFLIKCFFVIQVVVILLLTIVHFFSFLCQRWDVCYIFWCMVFSLFSNCKQQLTATPIKNRKRPPTRTHIHTIEHRLCIWKAIITNYVIVYTTHIVLDMYLTIWAMSVNVYESISIYVPPNHPSTENILSPTN